MGTFYCSGGPGWNRTVTITLHETFCQKRLNQGLFPPAAAAGKCGGKRLPGDLVPLVALQVYNAGGYNRTRKTGYITVTA
jgi:hypothetical protein